MPVDFDEVLSSRVRLRIMDAVSVRPRTLGELSALAGISVQGVLRHLNRLVEAGLVEERSLERVAPKARKVYFAKAAKVRDYSTSGFTIVKSTEPLGPTRKAGDLEKEAGELLILRRRIRDEAKRLGRMIDEAADSQEDLAARVDQLPLPPSDKLALKVALTEDTIEDGARVLTEYYGLEGRRSIETALSKAKRLVSK